MSVDHHHHHSTASLILDGLAIIAFVLAAFSVAVPINLPALGLAFFAAAHLI